MRPSVLLRNESLQRSQAIINRHISTGNQNLLTFNLNPQIMQNIQPQISFNNLQGTPSFSMQNQFQSTPQPNPNQNFVINDSDQQNYSQPQQFNTQIPQQLANQHSPIFSNSVSYP